MVGAALIGALLCTAVGTPEGTHDGALLGPPVVGAPLGLNVLGRAVRMAVGTLAVGAVVSGVEKYGTDDAALLSAAGIPNFWHRTQLTELMVLF